jgi:hypothetical protein
MPQKIGKEQIFTRKDVQDITQLSRVSLIRKVKAGELEEHRIAGAAVYTRQQVVNFLEHLGWPPETIEYRLKNRQEAES